MMDVVNFDKFWDNLFKGLNVTGGQSFIFYRTSVRFPLFGKESPRRDEPLDLFLILRVFMRLTIAH